MISASEVIYELASAALDALIKRHYVNVEYMIQGMFSYLFTTDSDAHLRNALAEMILFDLPRDKNKCIDYLEDIIEYCDDNLENMV